MARLLVASVMVLTVGTSTAHADTDDLISDDVAQLALEANLEPMLLAGAANTQGLTTEREIREYLYATGDLQRPYEPSPSARPTGSVPSTRVDCIISHESQGNPSATNKHSGAAGLGQFLSGTWRTTPQGQAGMSVYDPTANRAAIVYMLQAGRAREFDAVRFYGC